MEARYNLKSPAVKRLMKEAAELKDPTDHYHAQPLEANGRFEVGKKICLSISGHHPETWQPSWSIRTALLAIIGFMPTKGEGAIGSLDYTPEERKALAKKSQDFCCEGCGMNMKETLLPLSLDSQSIQADREAKELARQISFKAEVNSPAKSSSEGPATSESNSSITSSESEQEIFPEPFQGPVPRSTTADIQNITTSSAPEQPQPTPPNNNSVSPRQRRAQQQQQQRRPVSPVLLPVPQPRVNTSHTGSAVLIVLLTLALAALIFRRVYLANDYIFDNEL
ncbi:ubiquitin-conjugating enzyme E2 J1-like isoform X2 [Ambystoma mexicanum]|uniref:ubiquitin-conjugating enzyme E2 J1-like isoform X2 n=1 Tax=Ambystoma mexicanum TaxID=8296 RepID=UPI0037E8AB93